jgi:hypothetical protein
MSDERIRKGGCLCGAIRYETLGEPTLRAMCMCRNFVTNLATDRVSNAILEMSYAAAREASRQTPSARCLQSR